MKDTPPTPPPKPSIHLDWEEWAVYLTECDATDEQKRALIEAVWGIAMGFVDLGWDITSGEKTSGQEIDLADLLRHAVLNSDDKEEQQEEEV
ncbi:hypothetical protein [Cognatiyoonia sp. IB215182]|uniref:hypothetical protein n=1 Tax=Cognatiyoonia sp. IB215182 TaxID=3097353 RepID=UPI002A138AE7|nr:hypothetical protein [Cognatiyoonia sp. IB215182]MDX8353967.1 hypothetical protein [Cognatiyoonia sp. IB215182]